MSDMTRPPGNHTPPAPDARGESAPGTGRHPTAPGTGHDTARDLDADRGTGRDPDADRGVTHGTDADRAAAHGRDVPGADRHDGTDGRRGDHGNGMGTDTGTGMGTGVGTGTDKAGAAKSRSRLLAHEECDKLGSQLQHAVAGFVDGPRAAVEEADHVLEEIAARFTEAVTQRRRTLRHSWQSVEGGESRSVSSADTEQLRLALKDYRELAERLLHV
ncbi:hypothetical protein ACWD0Z_17305 [Streptomyces sp. NPDC003007]